MSRECVSSSQQSADTDTDTTWNSFISLGKKEQPSPESSGKGCYNSSDQPVSRVLYDSRCHRDGHFSRNAITHILQQPTRGVFVEVGNSHRLLGLAPAGVYHAARVTTHAVGSYPTFSPLPPFEGGLFSVALSIAAVAGCVQKLSGGVPHGARTFLELVT
jgi:hypothetical protein